MLVGRDSQLQQIAALLSDARSGRAGVATLIGDAGVGKTALLDSAVGLAEGFDVLRVVGVPAELTIGFAALGTLLSALAEHVPELPIRQRRAVLASLALDGAGGGEAGDLLALGAGVLTLLALKSAARPLLVIVDDFQWVDEESRRALGFVARRLGGEHVAMLLASRETIDLPFGLDQRILLEGLDVHAAGELLRERSPGLDPDVIAQLVQRCEGNALALVESAAYLDVQPRPGQATMDQDIPVPERIQAAYRTRLDAMPPSTRRALLLVACEGRGDLAVLAGAVTRVQASLTELDQAVEAGLLRSDHGQLRFCHPLLATCVVEEAGPAACRAAHTALAEELGGKDDDRAVWHRAAAAIGPDEAVSTALAGVAERAIVAGLPNTASRAWERAAQLSSPGPRRVALLVAAAETAVQSGSGVRAIALLGRLAETGQSAPRLQARRQLVQGRLALLQGRYEQAARMFLEAAPNLEGQAQSAAAALAIQSAVSLGDRRLVECALELATTADHGARVTSNIHSEVARLLVRYDPRDPALDPRLVEGLSALVENTSKDATPSELMLLGSAALQIGRLIEARGLYVQASGAAAELGDVPSVADAASGLAFCDFILGRWQSAYSKATEVLQLADEAFAPALVDAALLIHADIDSVRGHEERCKATCRRLRVIAETVGDGWLTVLTERCEGVLDLGMLRLDSAIRRFEAASVQASAAGLTQPYPSPLPDLVEAYLRQGRRAEAERAAAEFLARVGPASPPTARARALRVRALVAPTGGYDEAFDRSVELDEAVGLRFHAARTLLCHAERLRRDGRRVDARSRLLRAIDVFGALEAKPWLDRAEAELIACGGSPRPSTSGSVSQALTPQELQIAVLVSQGRRNREIAGELFLSLRTVEFHLSRVFRKLEISNRTQLAARMAD